MKKLVAAVAACSALALLVAPEALAAGPGHDGEFGTLQSSR
jgi:hypothetical protein